MHKMVIITAVYLFNVITAYVRTQLGKTVHVISGDSTLGFYIHAVRRTVERIHMPTSDN